MGLPIHVSEVPEFELRGECVHVAWRGVEVFVPIAICRASLGRINNVMDEWYESRGMVVPFSAPIAAE